MKKGGPIKIFLKENNPFASPHCERNWLEEKSRFTAETEGGEGPEAGGGHCLVSVSYRNSECKRTKLYHRQLYDGHLPAFHACLFAVLLFSIFCILFG